jgi:hypothetical protein
MKGIEAGNTKSVTTLKYKEIDVRIGESHYRVCTW